MIEDPVNPAGSVETGDTHSAPPVWNEPAVDHAQEQEPLSSRDLHELREIARNASRDWVVTRRKSFSQLLDKRRQKAARAILGTILKSSVAERKLSSLAGQLVANNQRLLRSTSMD